MTDLRNFDLNLLLILDVLLEERSITRTAHRLRVSQPTISFSLKKLRDQFGDELFVRSGGEMVPTERALVIEEPLRNIIHSVRHRILEEAAFKPERERGTLRLCLSDIGELEFLPNLIRRTEREAPGLQLQSIVLTPTDLDTALEAGDVDLAIGYFPDLISSNLQQQLLFRHTFVCLARRGHPSIDGEMTLDGFLGLNHLVVEHVARRKDLFERTLEEAGLSRSVALSLPNYVSVPFILEDSDLIATVPRPLANKLAPLCNLQIFEPPLTTAPIEVKLFWHRRYQRSPRHIWLRSVLKDISQNKPYLKA